MKLYHVEFETACCLEDRSSMYILRSEKKPTIKEAENALHSRMYSGAIYIDFIKEILEAEIRDKKKIVIEI